MTIEQQVTSLELSKKLKELGVKQESLFFWAKSRQTAFPEPRILLQSEIESHNRQCGPAFHFKPICSAFTVAELGEMLPREMQIGKDKNKSYFSFRTYKTPSGDWWVSYGAEEVVEIADTEADARAKMLVYLLDNNLITL